MVRRTTLREKPTRLKHAGWKFLKSVVRSNRGPATTEIDSPHLRGKRRLNRRGNLISSQKPSSDVNAWEFTGDQCGNKVGIWELDRVFRDARGLRRRSPILWARH